MKIIQILVICLNVFLIQSISFTFKNKTCFGLPVIQNQNYHIEYESVYSQNGLMVSIVSHEGYWIRNYTENKKIFDFNAENAAQICFQSMDEKYRTISFDVWTTNQLKIKNIAQKSEIYQLHSTLSAISDAFRKISVRQKFQQQKQQSHGKIIIENQNKIKIYGILKIILIILLAFFQILILKKVLSVNRYEI